MVDPRVMLRHTKLFEIYYVLGSYGVECNVESRGGYIEYLIPRVVCSGGGLVSVDYFDKSYESDLGLRYRSADDVYIVYHCGQGRSCSTVTEAVEYIIMLVAESLEL